MVACAGVVVWADEVIFYKGSYMCLYVLVCGPNKREHIDFVKGDCSAVLWVRVPWRRNPLVIVVCGLDVHPHFTVIFCDKLRYHDIRGWVERVVVFIMKCMLDMFII